MSISNFLALVTTKTYYRVNALISVNIVPSWDIEGRELASIDIPTREYFVQFAVVCNVKKNGIFIV